MRDELWQVLSRINPEDCAHLTREQYVKVCKAAADDVRAMPQEFFAVKDAYPGKVERQKYNKLKYGMTRRSEHAKIEVKAS